VISKFRAHVISYVLCREYTIKVRGETIKDLSKIGRPIESTIIVDNRSHNFRKQAENGV
jgi:TFIIF-interacting CTD phosphatase-like protein